MCHTKLILLVSAGLVLLQVSSAYQTVEDRQIASSSNEESQQHPAPEPYSFSYTAESNGGSSRHEESGDGTGRVTGFYTIMGEDGRERRVDYVADADGYRAQISTNEIGTRAQSSADANYQVQLPSAGQLEAAKISYEQYKYLEDTHATERQRVAVQSNYKQAQSQQSSINFDRQRQQQQQSQPRQEFDSGQTSTLQRGSSSAQIQEGQQAAFLPAPNNFGITTSQGSNLGSVNDQNDLGWRNAQLSANKNRTLPKLGSAADFSSTSSSSQEAGFNNNQQFVPANQQHLSTSTGGRNTQTGGIGSNQDGQFNYQSSQSQQQSKQNKGNFSAKVDSQQQQEVSRQSNRGRYSGSDRNELQRQIEQQFLLQASGDQDYPRQTNNAVSQANLTPSSGSIASFQAKNAQATSDQQRDEIQRVSDEKPAIPNVSPQTNIPTTNSVTEKQQQQQQVSSWNQQAARGSSYLTTGNERDYQQVTANQQQGDNSGQFNYSNQFAGNNQEQTNILGELNQIDEKNESQLLQEQQNGQVDQRNQQQIAQVFNQQAAGVEITGRPAPAGLISINLNELNENQRQNEQEVTTMRPADKQISGLNFSYESQVKSEQPSQQQVQQFNTQNQVQLVNRQPQQQQFEQTQVTREPVQTQPIFRQTFSQSGTSVENRPNSINQIIENITRQPIIQTSSEANQFRQEGIIGQQQQGVKGAPRLPGIQMRPTTTTTTTTDRPEPISEVSVTTNEPLFSSQEDQETTTLARVTYYQPSVAPTTTSTTSTTAKPITTSTTTTTTTTTTPAPTVAITRQTFVPTQRPTEVTSSFLATSSRRPVQQQIVIQGGVKGGNKAPSPLAFKRVNKTSEFQYIQLPMAAPERVDEPVRSSYVPTITTRAPLRAISSFQSNNLQKTEQAPYLTSTNIQSEQPFVKHSNATRGEARLKVQAQVQQQAQPQYQQFQQLQQQQQQQQQRPRLQANYSQVQVSTVSQVPNEATYVTIRPSQQAQAVEAKQQLQQLKGTKGGYSSTNKRQFWQQQQQLQQQKLIPTINTANQELARAMRSLTASVSYVDQEAQEHKQRPVSLSTTRKATLTSAEDYASLRGFGSRVIAADGQSF